MSAPVVNPSSSLTPSLPAAGPEDVQAATLAANDDRYSSITMEDYFRQWYQEAKSALQRSELEERMLNRRVIWNGQISEIVPEYSGEIRMLVRIIGFGRDKPPDDLGHSRGQAGIKNVADVPLHGGSASQLGYNPGFKHRFVQR